MATPPKPKRAVRVQVAPDLSPEYISLLNDQPWPEDGNEFARHSFHADAKNIWREWRTGVVAQYVARHRGRRPSLWWRFDAPEPRRRLSGAGVEAALADWRGEVWRWRGYPSNGSASTGSTRRRSSRRPPTWRASTCCSATRCGASSAPTCSPRPCPRSSGPMPDAPATRVLVKVGQGLVGGTAVERYDWIDATPEQALAYANNDPAWRQAKAASWAKRLWRRLF
jgi:hypothetical protein